METFAFTRRSDDLVYRFVRDHVPAPCYRRADRPDLTVVWDAALGCLMRDPRVGALVGRTWERIAADPGRRPPEGPWGTAKGIKSYLYDLSYRGRADDMGRLL